MRSVDFVYRGHAVEMYASSELGYDGNPVLSWYWVIHGFGMQRSGRRRGKSLWLAKRAARRQVRRLIEAGEFTRGRDGV